MTDQPLVSESPVVIIGAARSGTRFLRDAIAQSASLVPVNHDVSFVWRAGNHRVGHDELTVDRATPKTAETIRRRMDAFAPTGPDQHIVEKTVGNALRIPFVQKVYPNARFLVITRNGEDVIQSSYKQWHGATEWGRWRSKATMFRPGDLPYLGLVGLGQARGRLGPLLGRPTPPPTWGIRYNGIDTDVATRGVAWVAAQQWLRSLEGAAAAVRSGVPAVVTRYETLCGNADELERICSELSIPDPAPCIEFVDVASRFPVTGPWSSFLTESDRAELQPLLRRGSQLQEELQKSSA